MLARKGELFLTRSFLWYILGYVGIIGKNKGEGIADKPWHKFGKRALSLSTHPRQVTAVDKNKKELKHKENF